MEDFEYGSHFMVLATGRIGSLINWTRTKVTLTFVDKNPEKPENKTFKKSDVKNVDDRAVKAAELGKYIRGKISFKELTEGTNILPNNVDNDPKPYKVTVKDLLDGFTYYENKPLDEIMKWVGTICQYDDEISFPEDPWEEIQDKVTDKDILKLLWREFDDFMWAYDYNEEESIDVFQDLKNELVLWVSSKGKELPDIVIRAVSSQYDCDSIDKQSKATQKLFKRCLDVMCDRKDPKSIQKRGYCYYCGTDIYPNDWVKARDAFIEYYQLTGDASAANTLGYIYYYGRCNGGVPEYEEAFKYFSIGHAFTYFESTYKLADMFAHGYGVVKDETTANHLYWSVYEQNLNRFIMGDYTCKFADAALRIGNCYRNGIGERTDLENAYHYYLQADLAIRKRTESTNYYGDSVVFNGIQRSLEEIRQEYTRKGRKIINSWPFWTGWTLIDNRRCKIKIRELKNGSLQLSASPMKRRSEKKCPLMLITVSKADYCDLKSKIIIRTAENSTYKVANGTNEIIFDDYQYDGNGKTTFYLNDDPVGEINTFDYTFTAPSKKVPKPEGKLYHFVRVAFEESGKCYDYLCDNKSVKEGDKVIIQGYDGEKEVNVVSVFDRYENQLGLPLERYKKVIRKVK